MPYMDPMGMNVHLKTSHTKHGLILYCHHFRRFAMFKAHNKKGDVWQPPLRRSCAMMAFNLLHVIKVFFLLPRKVGPVSKKKHGVKIYRFGRCFIHPRQTHVFSATYRSPRSPISLPLITGFRAHLGLNICETPQNKIGHWFSEFADHVFASGRETVRVKRHMFTLLRNALLRYILYTCPNL